MPLDPEIIEAARKLKPSAVTAVLQDQAPGVYRIAYALSGRWDVGRGAARFVLNRSIKLMPKWRPDDEPDNWYHRFTIMTTRRSAKHQPDPRKDVLVEQAVNADQAYVAFVSALRQLDTQHREAFLLHHCERLNARYSALAMDCSTTAAETHLRAAEASLKLVAGPQFDAMVSKMTDAYKHLTPDPNELLPSLNGVVFKQVRVRRWIKRIAIVALLVIVAGLAWAGWKLYAMIGV